MDQIFALHTAFYKLYWFSKSIRQRTSWKSVEDPSNIRHAIKDHQLYGKMIYDNFECSVIFGNIITETFPVKSGVRQDCILSSILFLVTIDWVMRQTTSIRSRGIQWTLFSHLEDLDFVDDIAMLSSTSIPTFSRNQTTSVSTQKKTGLNISKRKSQIMHVNVATECKLKSMENHYRQQSTERHQG